MIEGIGYFLFGKLLNYGNFLIYVCQRAVHLNFRAGPAFPVPVSTVSPEHWVNKADTQQD